MEDRGKKPDRKGFGTRSRGFSGALAQGAENGIDFKRMAARQLLPIGLAFGLVVLLWDKIAHLDFAYIRASLATVGPLQWGMAALFSAISFWALGRYDRVVHRLIGSPTRSGDAQRAGVTAIALSQTIGMGVISSAFIRWRMLPEINLMQAMRISVIVSISFLSAWAVVASVIALSVPMTLPWAGWIAWAVLAGAALLMVLSVLRPPALAKLHIPPLRAMGAFLLLAFIDTAAAGAALWMVLPEGCDIGIVPLIAAYLIALGAGLISGTPGGMGAFELTLLALLPSLGAEPLMAAILAFRAVYYALPAVLAAAVTIRGPRSREVPAGGTRRSTPRRPELVKLERTPTLPAHVAKVVAEAPRAEAGLLRHGRLSLVTTANGQPAAMGAATGQSLVVLSDPIAPVECRVRMLDDLKALANRSYLSPFLYKIGARWAAEARRVGWSVLPIAREAWIAPADFSLDGSSKRQLRRKLRQAEKMGVTISEAGADLPLDEMSDIAEAWKQQRGGERGFSMGVWHPECLPHARVVLAHHQGRLAGFMTLHENQNEQVLDLMRMRADAPDGTMHALLVHAITCAAEAGCPRLSLAAVPLAKQTGEPWAFRHARLTLDRASGADGLRQFKTAFAPNWETLYAAAPTRRALGFGAMDVTREICSKAQRNSQGAPRASRPLWQRLGARG